MKIAIAVLGLLMLAPTASARGPSEISEATTACIEAGAAAGKIIKGQLNGTNTVYIECDGGPAADLYRALHDYGFTPVNAHTSNNQTGAKIVSGTSMCQWIYRDAYGRKMNFTGCYLALDVDGDFVGGY